MTSQRMCDLCLEHPAHRVVNGLAICKPCDDWLDRQGDVSTSSDDTLTHADSKHTGSRCAHRKTVVTLPA